VIRSRWLSAVVAVTLMAAATGACSSPDAADRNAPVLDVVTGLFPLAQAVEQIGQTKVQVTDIVPSGRDPVTYQLTAAQQAEVRAAPLVVEVGGGFQPSFEAAAAGAAHVIEVQAAVNAANPDVWLDPAVMQKVVASIAATMVAVNPAAAGLYKDGAEGFNAEVNSDGIDFQSTLATCPRGTIFTADGAFSSMANDYGLKDVVIGTGVADAASIDSVVAQIQRLGATTVFSEPWTPDADVQAVATAAHVKVDTLDTLTGPPAGGWPEANYIALLESDLGVLSSALGCPDLGTGT
jgi:ABC-type Zn uptake system ZnuABC Zn-binding protein ZnuA